MYPNFLKIRSTPVYGPFAPCSAATLRMNTINIHIVLSLTSHANPVTKWLMNLSVHLDQRLVSHHPLQLLSCHVWDNAITFQNFYIFRFSYSTFHRTYSFRMAAQYLSFSAVIRTVSITSVCLLREGLLDDCLMCTLNWSYGCLYKRYIVQSFCMCSTTYSKRYYFEVYRLAL